MSKEKSIRRNMFMSSVLTASNFVLPLITYSYVVRILQAEGTGKVAFVHSVLSYFGYVAALGIPTYGMREVAKVRDDKDKLSKLVHELFMVNLLTTLLAYLLLGIALLAVPKLQQYTQLIIVMSSSMLLNTLGAEWLYQGFEEYTYITIRSLIFKTISVGLIFLFVRSADDVVIYGAISIFAASASHVMNFINLRKLVCLKRYDNYDIRKHLGPVMVFFMSSMIMTIYGHFDSTMLGFMKGDTSVGIYNAAVKIKGIVLSVSTAVTSVLIPRMSRHFGSGDLKKFHEMLEKSFRVSMMLVLPLAVFVIFNAENTLVFLCGEEFRKAKYTLIVYMICVMSLTLSNLFGNQILNTKGEEKYYSKCVFIGLWINLGLNTALIPRWDTLGAAAATLFAEIVICSCMGSRCRTEIRYIRSHVPMGLYAAALVIACGLMAAAHILSKGLPLFFALCINAILYFGGYYGILLLKKEPMVSSLAGSLLGKIRKARKA